MTPIILILVFASISLMWMIVDSFVVEFTETHGLIGLLMMCIIFLCISVLVNGISTDEYEPDAIDVYRGNTTLEITYRDSIPVDTVVVFK